MFSVIVDPAAFDDPAAIAERTLNYCRTISACSPIEGVDRVLLPGEPEIISRADRHANGIPVDDETLRQLLQTGVDFGLDRDSLYKLLTKD